MLVFVPRSPAGPPFSSFFRSEIPLYYIGKGAALYAGQLREFLGVSQKTGNEEKTRGKLKDFVKCDGKYLASREKIKKIHKNERLLEKTQGFGLKLKKTGKYF